MKKRYTFEKFIQYDGMPIIYMNAEVVNGYLTELTETSNKSGFVYDVTINPHLPRTAETARNIAKQHAENGVGNVQLTITYYKD